MGKLALRLMIGDEEFKAIGHVAAQWAYLETQIDFVIDVLINQPSTKDSGLELQQSFMRRMEVFRKAANIVLERHPDQLAELLDIAQKISSLRGLRDDIIHGHWKLHRKKGIGPLETGLRISNRGKTLKVREGPFSAEKTEDVAAKISTENFRLTTWCQTHILRAS